ncbi:hypothetical protein MSG28_011848 [Choristoneura fumiferana]|uniref:Uncharacterized protein n=1 Tax=Choristoneura fumiferana TaxID=7141 RepID=A0ACC0KMN3_CHOFU|nr:hypothetical protein MSG28_011848 [Choristoneura fumiferana]
MASADWETRWSDDLVMIAGSRWTRKVQDRSEWRALGEAYVQQWTSFGCHNEDDDGSIINAKWILSSAHCFPCNTEFTVTVQQKTAKGEVKILGKVIPVNIIKHSAYIENDESIENRLHDIALIKTSKPIRFDEFTWPIELAKLPPKIGQSVIIAGYGDTELRQKLPREGAVEVSECPYEVDDLVCSWHKIRAGGGDSGGALTSRGRLVGITSASCPGAHVEEIDKCITVYTSVTVHLQWIMARIS